MSLLTHWHRRCVIRGRRQNCKQSYTFIHHLNQLIEKYCVECVSRTSSLERVIIHKNALKPIYADCVVTRNI